VKKRDRRDEIQRIEPGIAAGRVPPHDLDAEAAVLSAILLSGDALDRVQETLQPEHFYSDANGRIYEAALELANLGKPTDIITIASWLRDRERLKQIGGAAYLAQLADATPAVAHVAAHAEVVFQKWRVRQLVATCQRVAAEGYGDVGVVQEFVDSAEQSVYDLARKSDQAETTQVLGDVLKGVFQTMTEAAARGDRITGLPTGYDKFDGKTAGLHIGDLLIVAARPGAGKTSWVLNVATNVAAPRGTEAATVPGDGVAVFSLEMPREQLATRMVCSEARVDLSKVRGGMLQRDDWDRLTEAGNFLNYLPIWIDDTPAITLLALRAKIRRIQSEIAAKTPRSRGATTLGLVVVDYLQLMKGREGVNSREQEVSELSRGLKALAKELRVPVIALSQLSRKCEERSDKRPMLSDLRECIAADQLVPDARTGALVPMGLLRAGALVHGLSSAHTSATADVAESWPTGVKPVVRVTTRSGRSLRCTTNHPLLTVDGWRRVDDLAAGDTIACPRSVQEPTGPRNPFTHDELRLLGYLVCDGSYQTHRSVSYIKGDPVLALDACRIVESRFGVIAKKKPCRGKSLQVEFRMDTSGPNKNPLIQWLKSIGIHGQRTAEKALPWSVFECDNDRLATLLGVTWAGDGSVGFNKGETGGRLKFTSTSRTLIEQVAWMLLRLGVAGYVRGPFRNSKSTLDLYEVFVTNWADIERFAALIPLPGCKGLKLQRLIRERATGKENAQLGRLPLSITEVVRQRSRGIPPGVLGYKCQGKRMCQRDLLRVANRLRADDLAKLASPDVFWDDIESIEPDGEAECFDLRAPETGNFVVNGFFTHNSGSIEQDADTVMFIFRPGYYDKSADQHLAEFIIAKQRNGPTGTVFVRFDGSCTRFDNLAPGDYPDETE
jgi:replicative DNA helicase